MEATGYGRFANTVSDMQHRRLGDCSVGSDTANDSRAAPADSRVVRSYRAFTSPGPAVRRARFPRVPSLRNRSTRQAGRRAVESAAARAGSIAGGARGVLESIEGAAGSAGVAAAESRPTDAAAVVAVARSA